MTVAVASGARAEALSARDTKLVRDALLLMKIVLVFCAVASIVMELFLYEPGDISNGHAFAPLVVLLFGYCVVLSRTLLLPWDYRAGHKMVADTEVIRVSKFGFFDVDASEPTGAPGMMLGSVFYLYVKDPARKSGQRKFRVKMELYTGLHPGDQVTIGYLPRCGMLLSLDCGSYHYEPVRKRTS